MIQITPMHYRLLTLILAALVLSACGAATPTAAPTDEAPASSTLPTTVSILVAARDVHQGTRVESDDVMIVGWPLLEDLPLPEGALIVSEEAGTEIDQAVGRIAKVDIIKGTPILDNMLTAGSEPEP